VNINNVREASVTRAVTAGDLLFGKHILLRKGKKLCRRDGKMSAGCLDQIDSFHFLGLGS